MGVILKYRIGFPELDLAVSNHLSILPSFGLTELILDADITAAMTTGRGGTSFEVKLYDLPEKRLKELEAKRKAKKAVEVEIDLGYLDGELEPVLKGLASKVSAKVAEGKLVTTLKGLETATHAITNREVRQPLPASSDLEAAVREALSRARMPANAASAAAGEIDSQPILQHLSGISLRNAALSGKLASVLDGLSRQAGAAMIAVDGKLRMGRPVTHDGSPERPKLVPDANLAGFEPFTKSLPAEINPYKLTPLSAAEANGFKFVVLGDPKMRPGQQVTADVDGFDNPASTEFRVSGVVHSFTLAGGYVCQGIALKTCPPGDADCRRQARAGQRPSADAVAGHLSSAIEALPRKRPFVEVGSVKEYTAGSAGAEGHRSTLYWGQKAADEETQPSVRVPVKADEEKVFLGKPMVSPFAWHRCGLVVPVYPGMKALLHHNLGRADDALVGGFFWSEDPAIEPPANKDGDYWLCLPVDPPSNGPPTSSTKAANDLVGKGGLRVIEAKGLKITVGSEKLKAVGERPAEGKADELLIEHSSGTQVHIDTTGKVAIKAPKGLEIEGDVKITGSLEIV